MCFKSVWISSLLSCCTAESQFDKYSSKELFMKGLQAKMADETVAKLMRELEVRLLREDQDAGWQKSGQRGPAIALLGHSHQCLIFQVLKGVGNPFLEFRPLECCPKSSAGEIPAIETVWKSLKDLLKLRRRKAKLCKLIPQRQAGNCTKT